MRLAFGDCILDPDRRRLERAGGPVHLSPKAYLLLTVLLEQRPRALSKEDLCAALWPGSFVTDSSLTSTVTHLREALGDRGREPPLIRTVHRFGYAFDGDVRVLGQPFTTAGLACALQWGGRELVLHRGEHVVGRSPAAAVWLRDERVSRRHARLTVGDSQIVLEDLGSRNGTLHRGIAIAEPVALADGDEIRIGSATMIARLVDAGTTLTSFDAEPVPEQGRAGTPLEPT
jgi:DNA-binding winged helix-turn-helix (wHTH) protein